MSTPDVSLSRPLRVAFLIYRGNPHCGGQGVYSRHLTRELTDLSLPEIARAFNRRDHTTVLHAIRRVETRALEDAGLSRTVEELTIQLRSTNMDSTNVGSTQD